MISSRWNVLSGVVLGGFVAAVFVAACIDTPPAPPGLGVTDSGPGTEPDAGQLPIGLDASPNDDAGLDADAVHDAGPVVVTDAGADAGPKTYCETATPEPGVTNFFCADFDTDDLGKGFTSKEIQDGGVVRREDNIFYSAPSSVRLDKARFSNKSVAGQALTSAKLEFRFNLGTIGGVRPPSNDSVDIAGFDLPNTEFRFRYSDGATVEGSAFYGFFVYYSGCPSACFAGDARITKSISTDVWTRITLEWSGKTFVVRYDDVKVLSIAAPELSGTSLVGSLGNGVFPRGAAPPYAFDNFRFSVSRAAP